MIKRLALVLSLFLSAYGLSAQNVSARLGLLPYHWLDYQGVPIFIELGLEWEPIYSVGLIGSVKVMDDSFEENGRYNRPGVEISLQPRFYFDQEEGNDGPYIGLPMSVATYGNYTAVNSRNGCEDRFQHEYYEFSGFIGYKTPGRFGADFFGGPSYRTTYFYQESSCNSAGEVTNDIRRKWLLEIGVRLTYRL
jgi:hypothetical protein